MSSRVNPDVRTPDVQRSSSDIAPLGIKAICILGSLQAVAVLGISAAVVLGGSGTLGAIGAFTAAIAACKLFLFYGLWTLKPWAWLPTVILFGIGVLASAAALSPISFVFNVAVLLYVSAKRSVYQRF